MYTLVIACLLGSVTLEGKVVKADSGFELHVPDVGKYNLEGNGLVESDESVHVTGEYKAGGTLVNVVVLKDFEQAMVNEANEYRKRFGLRPLVPDAGLMRSARQHSTNMASRRSMYHGGTSGWSGENVAWNQADAKDVTRAWYNSPGHRANMLNSRFTKIGVGGVNRYWTQQFK